MNVKLTKTDILKNSRVARKLF